MRCVLMVAFHFPPLAGSSGIQRTLRFARYLPEFGWEAVVLTAHPRAYEQQSEDQLGEIPEDVHVIRAPAWDAARHFSIAGRYPGFLARPDRWVSWKFGARRAGLRAVRDHRPQAIWSTYPIATAHSIGKDLANRTGLPWVADFRDPMAQEGYPTDPTTWRSFARLERQTVEQAQASVFTTPGAVSEYRRRYPRQSDRIVMVENGYDEEVYCGLDTRAGPVHANRITLLHSGVVYPSERDPSQLFQALHKLRDADPERFSLLRVRFRAPVHDALLLHLAQCHGVESAIEVLPAITYREALTEMIRADGLLILQASNCNAQVPAKLYEYFRAGRPILALTDPVGDTARIARAAGISAIAPLDDAVAIADLLEQFVKNPRTGTVPTTEAVAAASRRRRTEQLANLLRSVCD